MADAEGVSTACSGSATHGPAGAICEVLSSGNRTGAASGFGAGAVCAADGWGASGAAMAAGGGGGKF
jgi:hypothetical protein